MTKKLTHFDEEGRPNMVDVSAKDDTDRRAIASGEVVLSPEAYASVKEGSVEKGDIRRIAELAGVMGAKKTSDLIPLCHPLPITGLKVTVEASDSLPGFTVTAEAKTTGKTGVEMEALTAVTTACLTVYDMCKAVDKSITIANVRLDKKSGGKSGDYTRQGT